MAKECGLRLANGVPTIFDGDGAHQFPLEGPTVFTLEIGTDGADRVDIVDQLGEVVDHYSTR